MFEINGESGTLNVLQRYFYYIYVDVQNWKDSGKQEFRCKCFSITPYFVLQILNNRRNI